VPTEQAHEIVLNYDPGATADHYARRALVHFHLAANLAQRDPSAQAAD
jgi:hypothetical protein